MDNNISLHIISACKYTREGMRCLMHKSCFDMGFNSAIRFYEFGIDTANINGGVNVFVLNLQGYNSIQDDVLEFLMERLPRDCPDARIVIMIDIHTIGKLKNYFLVLGNVYAVLDNSISLQDFQAHLHNVIMGLKSCNLSESKISLLSPQQLNVLKCMLNGMSYLMVASTLNIHYKTVISHRCSVLKKLGINSQQAAVMSSNDLHIMNKFLRKFFDL